MSYKVTSRSQYVHNVLFDNDMMSSKSFMVMSDLSTAEHICDVLNSTVCTVCKHLNERPSYTEPNKGNQTTVGQPLLKEAVGFLAKIPPLEECYKVIPFPKDEKESAFFAAGLAEMHKYLSNHMLQFKGALDTKTSEAQ